MVMIVTIGGVMQIPKKELIGVLFCLAAIAFAAAGWVMASSPDTVSTDNVYVRGDVTSLAPKVSGYVTAVEVEDNQTINAGDVLFRIDDRDYRARLAQAEANVQAARAQLANVDAQAGLQKAMIQQAEAQQKAAVAELDLATKTRERYRQLVRTNAVSQAKFDDSDSMRTRNEANVAAAAATLDAQKQRLDVLKTEREAALAAISQADAARDLARIDLGHTVVRAPVGGVIGNRQARVGRLVSPGMVLLDIVPVDDVWLVANFKETQVENIQPGQHVRVSVDAYPDRIFEGIVDSLAPGSGSAFSLLPSDNATGNFVRVVQRVPIKIRLVNNPLPGRIIPGMSARIDISTEGRS